MLVDHRLPAANPDRLGCAHYEWIRLLLLELQKVRFIPAANRIYPGRTGWLIGHEFHDLRTLLGLRCAVGDQ